MFKLCNPYTCIMSCPLRDDCKEGFDLHCEILRGIAQHAIDDDLNDIDAEFRALKVLKENIAFPPETRPYCLMEIDLGAVAWGNRVQKLVDAAMMRMEKSNQ